MSRYFFIGICFTAVFFGFVWYAYFHELLIIRNPWDMLSDSHNNQVMVHKKRVTLFFWRQDQWQQEVVVLTVLDDIQKYALMLVQAWLHEAAQLNSINHPCTVQSGLIDDRIGCLYISFTSSPLNLHKSTYAQIILLESLLKTLAHNLPGKITTLRLLINQAPLEHLHIDCSIPFPISGLGVIR